MSADNTPIYLLNSSGEPVYQPVVSIVSIQGAGVPRTAERWLEMQKEQTEADPEYHSVPVTTVSILPPGKSRIWIRGSGWSGYLSGRSSAEIAFTDRSGVHWIRRSDGQLEEIPDAPLRYFNERGLIAPFELQTPEPLS
jgi:hypothetical protein